MENTTPSTINLDAIKNLIARIYGDGFTTSHYETLEKHISETRKAITVPRKNGWDETDVVLITYADQFSAPGEKRLATFQRFFEKWLKPYFSHIHLLPFYPWSSDDGFSVVDYHRVDPQCGDWDDIARLNTQARLMFDFVCNHISAQSEWFADYLAQKPGYEDFFIAVDPATDLSAVTRPRALPLLTPFTMQNGRVRHLWTTFSEDQIDLNFASPVVLLAMVDVLLHYLREGAQYVRLDAVGFMWKTPGTSCIHLEKTHLLVKLFRAIADVVAPGTVIITETNVPHKDNIAYLGNGFDEAQMVYQFPLPPLVLHAIHTQNARTLCEWAQGLSDARIGETTWFNFLASHDGIGLNPLRGILPEDAILRLVEDLQAQGARVNWKNNPDGTRSPYEINVTYMDALSLRDDSDATRLARFLLAHALLLTFPGVPAIYIQSILGSRNDEEGVERLGYNRAINRQKYTEAEMNTALQAEGNLRHETWKQLGELISLRRQHAAFHPDSAFAARCINDAVLEIMRVADNGATVIALFNLSDTEQVIDYDARGCRELITGATINSDSLILAPWKAMWLSKA
ncbi:sugar phosphorylase [Cronobacter sakazakii]|uniref:Sugar phosphorylase n=4 Tax=Cronobacter sakazakii TaxID=28141 RepID=A0A7V7RGE8_CROSK|nr:alpha-amylase family glycosyl hydrolase [Cronobacter sakazakii]CCK13638.1 Putative sucrose phosphorylase [Cronobacter sakazakii 680]AKE95852.1 putative sucrose phosphorylase [Cronobacter sakazakii]AXW97464.2 sugar phosphorylase [Cronobacter sakazakii]EGT4268359.1 sugar phosphorylase [Cronobacter sakazakii]EGT4285039.1 sugar phosphorylase [Cronobacter sakazakii]